MNVQLGRGKVHHSDTTPGFMPGPACGGNRGVEGYSKTSAEVNCKKCLTILEKEAATVAEAAEDPEMMTEAEMQAAGIGRSKLHPIIAKLINKDNGGNDTMAKTTEPTKNDVTTDEGAKVVEQIDANIERARSLAEADNTEGLETLSKETEGLISSLSGKGSINVKKLKREAFKAAATVQEKPEAKVKAEVATLETKDYTTVEGVNELVTMGAEKVTEGVTLHAKTSTTARDVASVLLDIRRRIHNKDGHPDLIARSDAAKKAASAIYQAAGESLGQSDLDAYDVEEAVKKLRRAVQHQMSDVQAQYLRGLDDSPEEAALFEDVLKDKPEDVPASEWVAKHYDLKLKGQGEIARERYHEKKALEAGEKPAEGGAEGGEGEGEGEGEGAATQTPDEHVKAIVHKLIKDIKAAKPGEFENASEETKEAVRAELEEASKAIKAMITAVL